MKNKRLNLWKYKVFDNADNLKNKMGGDNYVYYAVEF